MTEARVQASSFRDNARAEGRKVVEDARARAEQAGDVDVAGGRRAIEAGEGRRGAGSARQRRDHVGDAGQSNPRRRRQRLTRDEVSDNGESSTFIGQLLGFAVIVWLVVRYVVPPVRKLMAARQDAVRQQLTDAASAAERLTESTTAHSKAVETAKSEAKRVVEEAQTDAGRITEQLQAQAEAEAERIKVQGARQVELLRAQLSRQLRLELGHESVRQAGELVRNYVADAAQQSATVDRFLDDLDAMAPASTEVEYPLLTKMRAASRQALGNLSDRFRTIAEEP